MRTDKSIKTPSFLPAAIAYNQIGWGVFTFEEGTSKSAKSQPKKLNRDWLEDSGEIPMEIILIKTR